MESEEMAMQRDLGDGLVLRRATEADTEALAAFNAAIFGDPGAPNEGSVNWTRDLMGGEHPTCAGDFTLVEDSRGGKIVSSLVWVGVLIVARSIPADTVGPQVPRGVAQLVGAQGDYRVGHLRPPVHPRLVQALMHHLLAGRFH